MLRIMVQCLWGWSNDDIFTSLYNLWHLIFVSQWKNADYCILSKKEILCSNKRSKNQHCNINCNIESFCFLFSFSCLNFTFLGFAKRNELLICCKLFTKEVSKQANLLSNWICALHKLRIVSANYNQICLKLLNTIYLVIIINNI